MKERPILFSAPMVRALLAGTKTQTRRVTPIADLNINANSDDIVTWGVSFTKPVNGVLGSYSGGRLTEDQARRIIASQFCPQWKPGGRLWVRETFFAWGRWETRFSAKKGRDEWHFVDMTLECGRAYLYAAETHPQPQPTGGRRTWWKRPAIFMPRWAGRITLEITGVRVERLKDINAADAIAEGIVRLPDGAYAADTEGRHYHCASAWYSYGSLWESINGPGSWDENPWVWVIEFRRVEGGAA